MSTKFIFALFVVASSTIGCLHAAKIKKEKLLIRKPIVYMLAELDKSDYYTGFFKVGKSVNIKKRFGDLQTGNPRKLRLIYKMRFVDEGLMNSAETAAKNALRRWSTTKDFRGGSEWFQVPDDNFEDFRQKFRRECQKYKVLKPFFDY